MSLFTRKFAQISLYAGLAILGLCFSFFLVGITLLDEERFYTSNLHAPVLITGFSVFFSSLLPKLVFNFKTGGITKIQLVFTLTAIIAAWLAIIWRHACV